jgi:hypothetical protein
MAQRGAMTRHDVGFSMLDDGRLIGVSDAGCNAYACATPMAFRPGWA